MEEIFFVKRHLLYCEDFLKALKEDFKGAISSDFFKNAKPYDLQPSNKNEELPILIFHCEFSQKRGPRTLRALRNIDRQINSSNWPHLFYPEIYILEGGYQNFVKQSPGTCEPKGAYIEMADKKYREKYSIAREKELTHWKKKSSVEVPFEERMRSRAKTTVANFFN